MSINLSAAQIASFDAMVKHAYQGAGMLRNTVRVRTGVIGSTHRFPKMGKGTATPRVPQTDVVPMNVAHTNATATLENWNAPEYTDIFDQAGVNFQEKSELAMVIASAIGRREDQLIIDAMDAASTTLTVSNDVGGTDSGLNVAKLRRARNLLSQSGAPKGKGERTYLTNTDGLEELLGETQPTSSDFNTVKALVDGEINHFVGFTILEMEDRDEGGLPVDGLLDRTDYAYVRSAVGLAVGLEFRTEINYIPEKTSWLSNGIFRAGAVAIDGQGIVEVTCRQAIA